MKVALLIAISLLVIGFVLLLINVRARAENAPYSPTQLCVVQILPDDLGDASLTLIRMKCRPKGDPT